MGRKSRGYVFEEEKQKSMEEIRLAIVTAELRNHISRRTTIEASGLSESGFYQCLKNPERFRLGTLFDIYEGLDVPEEERRFS